MGPNIFLDLPAIPDYGFFDLLFQLSIRQEEEIRFPDRYPKRCEVLGFDEISVCPLFKHGDFMLFYQYRLTKISAI